MHFSHMHERMRAHICTYLQVPSQLNFFSCLISNKFYEKLNLPTIHFDMLVRLCNFYICNYGEIIQQTIKLFDVWLIEVKMENSRTSTLGATSCFIIYVIDSPRSRKTHMTNKFNELNAKGQLCSD